MRKSKTFIYAGLGLLLVVMIAYLGGYRLSPTSISQELDQKAHFTPSEVMQTGISGNVATVVTKHDNWIQCRTMTGVLGLIWKADSYTISPMDLSNPTFSASETDMTSFYLDACQWARFGVDPVLILKAADDLVQPYLGLDGKVLSHKINRILDKKSYIQVDSSIVFTSKGNTVTAKYVTFFKNSEAWVNYGSMLRVDKISVGSSLNESIYWNWYHQTYVQSLKRDQSILLQSYLVSEEIVNQNNDLEHGIVTFASVVTGKTSGWTGIETKSISAKYDLDLGWVFTETDEKLVQILDLTGTWNVDLYDAVDGPSIYVTTIKDLTVSGSMTVTTNDSSTTEFVNTTQLSFTYKGKHYEGKADYQEGYLTDMTTGLYMDRANDNALRIAIQFNKISTNPMKFDSQVVVYADYLFGVPVRIK